MRNASMMLHGVSCLKLVSVAAVPTAGGVYYRRDAIVKFANGDELLLTLFTDSDDPASLLTQAERDLAVASKPVETPECPHQWRDGEYAKCVNAHPPLEMRGYKVKQVVHVDDGRTFLELNNEPGLWEAERFVPDPIPF